MKPHCLGRPGRRASMRGEEKRTMVNERFTPDPAVAAVDSAAHPVGSRRARPRASGRRAASAGVGTGLAVAREGASS